MSSVSFQPGEIDREPHIGSFMEKMGVVPRAGMRVLIIDPVHGRLPKWCAVRQMETHVVCLTEIHADVVRAECGEGINVFRMPPSGFLAGCMPQAFDLIVCTDWPRHPEKLELLAQSRKVIRWGGQLIIICPATSEAARLQMAAVWDTDYTYNGGLPLAHRCFSWKKQPGWLISSYPRCGTHMLLTALEEHPELSVLGEIFNPNHPAGTHGLTSVEQVLEASWTSPQYGFAMHCYIGRKGGAPGMQPSTKHFNKLWDHLPRNIKVVSCQRRNLLARHVSHLKANQTKIWVGFNKSPIKKAVHVDADKVLQDIAFASDCWQQAAAFWPSQHVVYYEDLLTDYATTMRSVQEYLGVYPVDLVPRTSKLGRPLRDDIENFGHLRQALAGRVPDEWFKE